MYDLIIVGLGAAGISAAIYAKRSNLKVLCLEKGMPGGIINYIDKIDNYPALPNISGADFSYKLYEHLISLNIEYKLETVLNVFKEQNTFKVKTKEATYETKKVIIASGRKARKLGLANEEKFLGRGISYCAVCDGAFFKNQTIAVVGSGRSAVQETLYLSSFAYKIYMLIRKDKLSVSEIEDAIQSNQEKGSIGLINSLAKLFVEDKITLAQAKEQIEEKNIETLNRTIMQLKIKRDMH